MHGDVQVAVHAVEVGIVAPGRGAHGEVDTVHGSILLALDGHRGRAECQGIGLCEASEARIPHPLCRRRTCSSSVTEYRYCGSEQMGRRQASQAGTDDGCADSTRHGLNVHHGGRVRCPRQNVTGG